LQDHCDALNQSAQGDVSLIDWRDFDRLIRPLSSREILVCLELANAAIETINFRLELVDSQLTV
jgi:hypothetical protein